MAKREVVTIWKHLARTTICKSFKRFVLDLNSQRTFQKNNVQKNGYNNNNPTRFINKINSEFDLFWLCYFHPFNNITYHYTKYIISIFSSTSDLSANALAKSASYWSPGVSWGIILHIPCWQGLHQNVWLHSDLDIGRYKGLRKSYHCRPWCGGGA